MKMTRYSNQSWLYFLLMGLLFSFPKQVFAGTSTGRRPDTTDNRDPDPDPKDSTESRGLEMALGGAGLGALGYFGGAVAGVYMSGSQGLGALAVALLGGSIGGAVMMPIGVHGGNDGRGSLGATMGVSVVVVGAGLGLVLATEEANLLWAIPVTQLLACMAVESATSSKTRLPDSDVQPQVNAVPHGLSDIQIHVLPGEDSLGFGISGRF